MNAPLPQLHAKSLNVSAQPTLAVGRYTFECRFLDEALLPPFKGSSFRGVFGRALKGVTCVLRQNECPSCPLHTRCLYARVFENSSVFPNYRFPEATPPRPYVIEPPLDTREHFSSGELFCVDLLLFGEFNKELPYFVYSFLEMGKIGLGKHIDGKRARFEVVRILQDGIPILAADQGMLQGVRSPKYCLVENSNTSLDKPQTVTVSLLTPLRTKHGEQLASEMPFHVLIRSALRRISAVFSCFGAGEPDLPYKELVASARSVEILASSARWQDWKRFSNRQDCPMYFGGLVGTIAYKGDIASFLPLLEVCRDLHIGKQATFGLGKISFRVEQ